MARNPLKTKDILEEEYYRLSDDIRKRKPKSPAKIEKSWKLRDVVRLITKGVTGEERKERVRLFLEGLR